ncbi:GlxA family transcriptional regulator [Methylobacterium brachiatum]|uniref:GlxA family transcriptional regulator n=1 Tax=Methylobacterium brachiatum TaxID=269660 RepID=UPI000EFA7F90|nr:DJ-1/PfpI family protein [Methylobacterium brachiatum]AYO84627.1 helix-turn-helix domain-containing protein [Methylobacterium brachiatum]
MERRLLIVAGPGVQMLDVSGPLDVFAEANVQAGRAVYRTEIVSAQATTIATSSGARLLADRTIFDADPGAPDTVLVAGSPDAPHRRPAAALLDWLRRTAPSARRFGSVCTGAFALAEAGLLDGRRITTHWAAADALARRYPAIRVEPDAIQVRDGPVCTAAGVTAGLDLAVTLVEEDLGRELAKRVAAQLVMFFKRPGGQMQFSRSGAAEPSGRAVLQEVQRWIAAAPAEDHSVARLAERAGLSPRHFARLFRSEVGMTPADWVEAARVAAARRRLEAEGLSPKQVAALTGFANADTLRRAFVRHVGITPAEFRRRNGVG